MKVKDVEKSYANKAVAQKLRRLADALENGKPFNIQISGQRVRVAANPIVEMEYEKRGGQEEIEIEVRWKAQVTPKPAAAATSRKA